MHTATDEVPAPNEALASPLAESTKIKIQSRFGEIEVDTATKMTFKNGLLGIPAATSFCLTELPNVPADQFKLLQSLEDYDLSFIVIPSLYENQLIKKADLDDVCQILEVPAELLLILFIVTISDTPASRQISINVKAPVFVNVVTKAATQYVFQNSSYEIQHIIS